MPVSPFVDTTPTRIAAALERIADASEKIAFFLGSLDSHSTKRLKWEAKERGIKVVYHDPTVAPWPKAEHGADASSEEVLLVGVPLEQRKGAT